MNHLRYQAKTWVKDITPNEKMSNLESFSKESVLKIAEMFHWRKISSEFDIILSNLIVYFVSFLLT